MVEAMVRTAGLEDSYYSREPCKQGFIYRLPDGSELKDAAELERIARLAIPPAYTEVRISPDPEAELQAVGRDSAGRLQYRYHPDFVQGRSQAKWKRLGRFARQLPQLRQTTARDLRREALSPPRVMALMTRLLYMARFRVGSDAYAQAHKTYGLTTLRQRHVKVNGHQVEFRFKGKHGIWQHKLLTDATLANNLSRLLELPGPWLFQALDGERKRIHAQELNAYIREAMGPFSAKDFRTWGGTLLAAEFLAEAGPPPDDKQAKKTLVECVKYVAADLGNTPAVVRAHYICPTVFDHYLQGRVLDDFEKGQSRATSSELLTRSELALQRMLESRAKTLKAA